MTVQPTPALRTLARIWLSRPLVWFWSREGLPLMAALSADGVIGNLSTAWAVGRLPEGPEGDLLSEVFLTHRGGRVDFTALLARVLGSAHVLSWNREEGPLRLQAVYGVWALTCRAWAQRVPSVPRPPPNLLPRTLRVGPRLIQRGLSGDWRTVFSEPLLRREQEVLFWAQALDDTPKMWYEVEDQEISLDTLRFDLEQHLRGHYDDHWRLDLDQSCDDPRLKVWHFRIKGLTPFNMRVLSNYHEPHEPPAPLDPPEWPFLMEPDPLPTL